MLLLLSLWLCCLWKHLIHIWPKHFSLTWAVSTNLEFSCCYSLPSNWNVKNVLRQYLTESVQSFLTRTSCHEIRGSWKIKLSPKTACLKYRCKSICSIPHFPTLCDWWVTMLPEGLSGELFFSFHICVFKSLRNKDEEHIQVFGKIVQRLYWHTLGASPVSYRQHWHLQCSCTKRCPYLGFRHPICQAISTTKLRHLGQQKVKFATSTQIKCRKQYALKYCSRKWSPLVVFIVHEGNTGSTPLHI